MLARLPAAALVVPVGSLLVVTSLAVRSGVPMSEAALCLAIAAALAWQLRHVTAQTEPSPWPRRRLALAAGGLAFGFLAGSWLVVAVGWMHLARSSVTRHFDEPVRRRLRPWWPVLVMAVPWVWADAWWLGWQMRMASATVATVLLTPALPNLAQQGTTLLIDGVRVDVAASCAGLGLLQALLTLGLAAAARLTGSAAKTVAAVPFIVLIATAANIVRVVLLTLVAVGLGPEVASRTLHDVIGYGVLALLAWCGWTLFDRASQPPSRLEVAT